MYAWSVFESCLRGVFSAKVERALQERIVGLLDISARVEDSDKLARLGGVEGMVVEGGGEVVGKKEEKSITA